MTARRIELLSPAKDLTCGIEAVRHGADAVYIGAPRFGARAAAGNSVADIATLVTFAHAYNVKVYVTLNTILRDEELTETQSLVWQLYRIGVDALIVQDMALLQMALPPIPLHGSTQMDNRQVEHVQFLAQMGVEQVVLPREFTLEQIAAMHKAVPQVQLEAFVHGALCVSYSGQCYLSQACTGRSANRGECAQMCRLPYDLVDATGKVVVKKRHLLSLKDMNQSELLEQLLDAGVTSLKIEGRLKDVTYVKNVTAYYRQKLDRLFARRPEYCKASSGSVALTFTPDLEKSFNRGYTHYFLEGRKGEISSFATPKWMGEEVGVVKEVRGNSFNVAGLKSFSNGDGLTFIDAQGNLQGFRVNRVERNRLFLHDKVNIAPRTKLYRNFDQAFERVMAKPTAERKIGVDALLGETAWGFSFTLTDEDGNRATRCFGYPHEEARTSNVDNIRTQLAKLGDVPFVLGKMELAWSKSWFIPSSVLTEWRRSTVALLLKVRRIAYRQPLRKGATPIDYPQKQLTYLANVMNHEARAFYRSHGVCHVAPAYEQLPPPNVPLMFCKHCLRYSMGWCPKYQKGKSPYTEPLYLVAPDNTRFRLEFDCKKCEMRLLDGREACTAPSSWQNNPHHTMHIEKK